MNSKWDSDFNIPKQKKKSLWVCLPEGVSRDFFLNPFSFGSSSDIVNYYSPPSLHTWEFPFGAWLDGGRMVDALAHEKKRKGYDRYSLFGGYQNSPRYLYGFL